MTVADLIAEFRDRAFDQKSPPLWTDTQLIRWANDAQREACRRGKLLIDSTDDTICSIDYDTVDPVLDLDTRIISIREAIVDGQTIPLDEYLLSRMNELFPGWRSAAAQFPMGYIKDYGSKQIRLYPQPTQAGTVLLSVVREPLEDMAKTDEPELPARYHMSLVEWLLYRAYSLQDPDTCDPQRAQKALTAFETEFGRRSSARNEKWQEEQSGRMTDTLV